MRKMPQRTAFRFRAQAHEPASDHEAKTTDVENASPESETAESETADAENDSPVLYPCRICGGPNRIAANTISEPKTIAGDDRERLLYDDLRVDAFAIRRPDFG
jgi:hypothetical protein